MNYGAWLGWQIDYLLYLQNFRDVSHHVLDKFFIFVTLFGEVSIPIMLICIIYWCVSKKAGQFMLFSWLTGFLVNIFAKVTACIYRPWVLDCRVHPVPEAIPAATGYSFPSGHTAGVTSAWGSLMVSFWDKKWLRILCPLIIVLVIISRNYLGVHTPQDVVISFFVSVFVLWLMYKVFNWIESDKEGGNRDLIFVGSVLTALILTICYVEFKSYPIHYLFGKILYDPCSMKLLEFTRSGFFFGSLIGWLIERRFVGFNSAEGTPAEKILRALIGLSVVIAMYSFESVMKSNCAPAYVMFVQMMMVGLFITFIYPFIVKKFGW